MSPAPARTKIWLDCDPGRDDALAILLALHMPQLDLLGISSCHGNATLEMMTFNCVRLLCSYGTPEQAQSVIVAKGAAGPLIPSGVDHDPLSPGSGVHGVTGLDGVEGLLGMDDPVVAAKQALALETNAVEAIVASLRSLPAEEKLVLVATGAYTNIAVLLTGWPELCKEKIDRICVMGGAEGRGNKSPVAEANVLCDPHAASIVLNFPLPVIMAPLNMTHTCLFTPATHRLLMDPNSAPAEDGTPLPEATTVLRQSVHTNLREYAASYKRKYNFSGPPLHDALTICQIARPELFTGTRYRVDVELNSGHAFGATVVDLWEYKKASIDQSEDNWGRNGKNVMWLETIEAETFWNEVFLNYVAVADKVAGMHK